MKLQFNFKLAWVPKAFLARQRVSHSQVKMLQGSIIETKVKQPGFFLVEFLVCFKSPMFISIPPLPHPSSFRVVIDYLRRVATVNSSRLQVTGIYLFIVMLIESLFVLFHWSQLVLLISTDDEEHKTSGTYFVSMTVYSFCILFCF